MEVLFLPRTKLIGWRDAIRKMAGDQVNTKQSFMDLNFQSLASQELDIKQMELDLASAKLDKLRRELEDRRAGPPEAQPTQGFTTTLSPSLARRHHSSQAPSTLAPLLTRRPPPFDAPLSLSPVPVIHSPSLSRRPLPSDGGDSYLLSPSWASLQPVAPRGRPTSPRPLSFSYDSVGRSPSPRLPPGSYDFPLGVRSASPGPEGLPGGAYTDWSYLPRQAPSYEGSQEFTTWRVSDDVTSLRRRTPRNWNESDLDARYEKKMPQERTDRVPVGGVPLVGPWRESSLDHNPGKSKVDTNAPASTLPRGYKFSSGAGERGPEGGGHGWRVGTGTLPRSLPSQQPISRIPVPPAERKSQEHRPLPLSMIFRLQNAFWERQGLPMQAMSLQQATPPQQAPPTWSTSSAEGLPLPPTALAPSTGEELPRPLSPTRLQPNLPPSLAEVQRVLEDMPRPLRRRGSQEHTTPPLPSHHRQYQQIMGRLFGRPAPKQSPEPLRAEEKLLGSTPEEFRREEKLLDSIHRLGPTPEEQGPEDEPISTAPEQLRAEEKLIIPAPKLSLTPEEPLCVIIDGTESRVGLSAPVTVEAEFRVPVVTGNVQTLERRSALKGRSSPRRNRPQRARMNPLVLLLDAALTGELDIVTQALKEVNDPSQPNEEGITALHNAICGANYHIVTLLISSGANVNAADSHGWTPLHCAASCNDLQLCATLVRHGAAILSTTYSDGSLAVEKCDQYREGYRECLAYLTEVEQCMGEAQSGVVYALWDYPAEFADELSLREGDPVTVLRKDGEEGTWWWASLCGREGYVPRNYFGLFPRVRPQRSPL
ncbi:hypothetical protein FKM82_015724 [Ascaphus truei]